MIILLQLEGTPEGRKSVHAGREEREGRVKKRGKTEV
jgi:hypothetical protein